MFRTMGRLAGFKYRTVARKLRALGFSFERPGHGSHEIWIHAGLQRVITVPHHPGELPEGTLRAILKQAGVEVERFLEA